MKIKYTQSAVSSDTLPDNPLPEVALAGRSNAGKSTFINLVSQSPVAKVSQTPGKTRLLNFFNVNERYYFVDMPGYGFASRSQKEMDTWGPMVEEYLSQRNNLCGVLLFLDIRRPWTNQEEQLVYFLNQHHRPLALVLTKTDQLNQKELKNRLVEFKKITDRIPWFTTTKQKKTTAKEVEDFVYKSWVQKESK
ncbi:MAG: ribosome biogenesis GTP-binding protein YihA/YsxC [Bdellovibrionales bacterium]|nr:ribosome biogenesis GTP-binding protein YihA/YsxC [Bdellovibrionales bacterium]